ncbi:hypothetical protein PAXRUDRAFT_47805, partial [Paxillus rubicundulus Ve08.2h10]
LHKVACHSISICPNSVSCKQLFNAFGSILMKWCNQLSTKNLTCIAELKMYVHEK